ncbi:hypothetical protein COOONC_14952, partial [Cooperia oncophora]
TLTNRISTDNQWGFPCWADYSLYRYTNSKVVQDALHIPDGWRKQQGGQYKWSDCNDALYDQYQITYNTTNEFFQYVVQNVRTPNFRFLIYNGDVDTACNYLGDSWFIRDVAKENNLTVSFESWLSKNMLKGLCHLKEYFQPGDRIPWFFSENNQLAGFAQRYSGQGGQGIGISIDVLTVKGAGHMVPNDKTLPISTNDHELHVSRFNRSQLHFQGSHKSTARRENT